MFTKSFTLLFYLKKRKNYVKGELPIYMRLTVDGQRIEISTKREYEPEKWNSSAGRKNGVREDVKLLNAYLDTLQSKVYDVHRQLILTGRPITAESVKNMLVGNAVKPKMILEIFREHNDKMSKLVGTDFATGTLERYKTSFEHTREFIKYKYKAADLLIDKLDYDFIAIRILGNTVINANNMKMSWTPYKGHEAPHEAISIAGSHHFEVAWNHVYDCVKEGIDVKETAAYGTVHHNYVHDLKRQGLYIDAWFGQLKHIEMYRNVVHNCEAGIAISSEDGPNTKNLKIHHNLIYNNRATGIFFSKWGADNLREEIDVSNNTFYRNGWGKNFSGDPQYWLSGGCYLYSTKLKDLRIQNNIFAHNFPFEIGHTSKMVDRWASLQHIDISRNLIQDINKTDFPIYLHTWLRDSVYSTTGTHAIKADPLFENPEEGDFRLKEKSPAKDGSGNYLGAFPKGFTKEDFWWKENFPPVINMDNYQANYPSGTDK